MVIIREETKAESHKSSCEGGTGDQAITGSGEGGHRGEGVIRWGRCRTPSTFIYHHLASRSGGEVRAVVITGTWLGGGPTRDGKLQAKHPERR